jgi:hypothetical protein
MITVTNCGQDILNNVILTDPNLPGFPHNVGTLAIGQGTVIFAKKSWGVGTHPNTVTGTGTGASSAESVTNTASAQVTVVPISVNCEIALFAQFDMDNNTNDNHVTLPASGTVQFELTVNNPSTIPLSVAIVGLPCSVDIDSNSIPTTVVIPAGGSTNFVCYVDVVCPGTNISVTVTGTALANEAHPCIYDANGNAITTSPSSCNASVDCQSPVTCRVTGGGRMDFDITDQSCIAVNTTLFPTKSGDKVLSHVTHGGQLGAPFAAEDPAGTNCLEGIILGNPCIRGQWQHTRHYQGQGNPREVFDMDFHSNTPKGIYDSLKCACLGCCDPLTGAFISPIEVNGLCNPDDHKICGPQPRPAGANAIIFSGVGKFKPENDTPGKAKAAEYVIFRVYIEDRSEPGGHHPKGAVNPSDIYCFQAWKTGIPVAKKPDFTTVSTVFRTALSAANCQFLQDLKDGTLPIGTLPSPTVNGLTADVQDCGPLNRGNHQIHPSTSATCEQ